MPQTEDPTDDPRVARQRRCVSLNKNLHIATTYLDQWLQVYFKHFLVPLLGIHHFWYCYKWQEQGSGHIHGFIWLKDGPKADEIDWEALKQPNAIISEEQTVKMRLFTEYWNRVITASSPFP